MRTDDVFERGYVRGNNRGLDVVRRGITRLERGSPSGWNAVESLFAQRYHHAEPRHIDASAPQSMQTTFRLGSDLRFSVLSH